jgi:hypothetical protein
VKGSLNKSWIFKTFFGVIMGEEWSKGVILVTNKRLVIRSGSYSSEISMKDVLTVGREVYSDVKLKYSSRSINMIDFKTVLGVSAVIYDGPQEVISEFDKIVSRARVEARGLTLLEKSILVLLDRKQPIATILARGNIDKRTLDLALARLKDIGYVTEDGNLTSYGINALPERTYDYST